MQVSLIKSNALLIRSAVVGAAFIICVVFYQLYSAKKVSYTDLNQQLTTQSIRFKTLNDMTLLVKDYQEKFNQFMPVKQYAKENRLFWLDAIDAIRNKNKIPELEYTISARRNYDYSDGFVKDKGIDIFVSDVTLSMKLMHEADLISVVRDIKEIKPSIHVVSSCEIKKINEAPGFISKFGQPNIDAVCHVKWFTFKVQ